MLQSMVPANLALSQIEKLRGLLQEREVEVMKLRHENTLLKQVERRQQRDLELIETKDDDAPRIIKGLRDEVTNLKHKLKLYFAQLSTDARHIRHLGEEKRRMREQVTKLQKLVEDEGLKQKENLEREKEAMKSEKEKAERAAEEATKRASLLEKNLSTDNRHLRGRMHNLEAENTTLQEKVEQLEDAIKVAIVSTLFNLITQFAAQEKWDKDKEIASLSIYRYNAVHRQSDGICRSCAKRKKEESEARRRAEIYDKLPTLSTPHPTLTNSTTVDVQITIPDRWEGGSSHPAPSDQTSQPPTTSPPPHPPEKEYEFTRITLLCSDDPAMVENVRTVHVEIEGVKKEEGKPKRTRKATGGSDAGVHKRAESEDDEGKREGDRVVGGGKEGSRVKIPGKSHCVTVVGLDPGKVYYFQVVAGCADVDGPPSDVASILVDALPPAPPPPTPIPHTNPPTLLLHMPPPPSFPTPTPHSRIRKYRIYHSSHPSHTDESFIADVLVRNTRSRRTRTSTRESERGTSVDSLRGRSPERDEGGEGVEFLYEAPRMGVMHYFRVRAENVMGVGEASGWSEGVVIDIPPSTPTKPHIKKLSSTSIQLYSSCPPNGGSDVQSYRITTTRSGDTSEVTEIPATGVNASGEVAHVIEGLLQGETYVFYVEARNGKGWSERSVGSEGVRLGKRKDMRDAALVAGPVPGGDVDVEGLVEGGSYWVGVCWVGEGQDGSYSDPAPLHLASALPLPQSPPPTPLPPPPTTEDDTPDPAPLTKTPSKSSSLSMREKIENMHHGMPAYHEPPIAGGSTHASMEDVSGGSSSVTPTPMEKGGLGASMTGIGSNVSAAVSRRVSGVNPDDESAFGEALPPSATGGGGTASEAPKATSTHASAHASGAAGKNQRSKRMGSQQRSITNLAGRMGGRQKSLVPGK
ncbi:hypothetical protein HDV00_001772 [Rhizophlyctis rosea]|nr:hypothetical protein HDV00_001772 [Rhizophlyctis rosea]